MAADDDRVKSELHFYCDCIILISFLFTLNTKEVKTKVF